MSLGALAGTSRVFYTMAYTAEEPTIALPACTLNEPPSPNEAPAVGTATQYLHPSAAVSCLSPSVPFHQHSPGAACPHPTMRTWGVGRQASMHRWLGRVWEVVRCVRCERSWHGWFREGPTVCVRACVRERDKERERERNKVCV